MRRFNVTGLCVPEEDYMADISGKIRQIKKLIDERRYFAINRARQYGKTTILAALGRELMDEYIMASISFEGLDDNFNSSEAFCAEFMELMREALKFTPAEEEYTKNWVKSGVNTFKALSRHITEMCKDKKIVLMIDEVDKASNNLVFLHFLSTLREKFLARKNGRDYTFHSVIFAGVCDIKNNAPYEGEEKIYNSPWNIASDFEVDMSFNPGEIAYMLGEYEADHKTGMDITAIAEEIYSYTNGYPFLVSRICQHIDEKLNKEWTLEGVQRAVKITLDETNTLFDDVFKNLENNTALSEMIYELLILGEAKPFVIDNPVINTGVMYGFLKNSDGRIAVSNKIFGLRMINYYISKDLCGQKKINGVLQNDIVL